MFDRLESIFFNNLINAGNEHTNSYDTCITKNISTNNLSILISFTLLLFAKKAIVKPKTTTCIIIVKYLKFSRFKKYELMVYLKKTSITKHINCSISIDNTILPILLYLWLVAKFAPSVLVLLDTLS